MSRCFQFPPPGCERKHRIDGDNLLVKEEDNEKKEKSHKRDKNKEKKEGKERDKDKSKDKKKDKSHSRDERVGSNSPPNHFMGITSAQEHGQRIGYVGVATRIENTSKINDRDKERGELLEKLRFDQTANGQRDNGETRLPKVAIVCKSNEVDRKRAENCRPIEEKRNHMHQRIKKGVQNKEKYGKIFEGRGFQIDPAKDTEFVQELGRRIRAENGDGGHQVIAKPNLTNQKGIDSNGDLANCDNAIFSHSSQSEEISNFGNGINRKDGHPKLLVVQNIKELEERGHQMVRLEDSSKKFSIGGSEQRRPEMVRASDMSKSASIGSMLTAKRKEPEPSGFLHDNGVRPVMFARGIVSPQSNTESGRILQHSKTITLCASKQGTPTLDSLRLENKELKVVDDIARIKANGPIVSPESHLGSLKSPSSVVDADGGISAHGSPLGSCL